MEFKLRSPSLNDGNHATIPNKIFMTASPLLSSFDSVFNTHLEQCANCNCTFSLASLVETANSRRVCQQCLVEKYAQCNWTSKWYLTSDLIKTLPVRFWHLSQQLRDSLDFQRGERRLDICRTVIDDYFLCCSHCGGYSHEDDTSTTNLDSDICANCYSLHYFTCDLCKEVYHTDDYGSNGECESCESRREPDDSDSPDDYCLEWTQ